MKIPVISIIIPVKYLNRALFKTVNNYKRDIKCRSEIIIVYDIRSVEWEKKFNDKFYNEDNIVLLLNPNKGRINALNHGYMYSKGDIIKCIDSDDIILNEYFEKISILDQYPAHCHNALLINENNKVIGSYTFEINILNKDYNYVLSNLKSTPRWVWSFKREIAKIIFPIPPELFAEDVWFSLIIKKNCKKIYHINESVYLYRQHKGGEWGGIKNFSADIMLRRANWNLALIPVLIEHKHKLGISNNDVFNNIINYYKVFLNGKGLFKLLSAKTTIILRAKLFIVIYFPKCASAIIQYKWHLNRLIVSMTTRFNTLWK